MNYFIKDVELCYFFKKKKFIGDKEQILEKLIINNILFLDNFDLNRFINDIRLVESLIGFKFNQIRFNYRNIYIKNRYLYVIALIKFKINFIYLFSFIDYIFFYEIIINFLINNYDKFRILNIFKNYYLNEKLIFINLKLHYIYLNMNNKRRYKKIIFYNWDYFDPRLWLNIYWFFKKKYYSQIFFNLIENLKIRYINEKT